MAKCMYAAWSPKRPRHIEHKSPSAMSIVFHTQHLRHENSREWQMIIVILLSLERFSAAVLCCSQTQTLLLKRLADGNSCVCLALYSHVHELLETGEDSYDAESGK